MRAKFLLGKIGGSYGFSKAPYRNFYDYDTGSDSVACEHGVDYY
jgi:hypothetical protein